MAIPLPNFAPPPPLNRPAPRRPPGTPGGLPGVPEGPAINPLPSGGGTAPSGFPSASPTAPTGTNQYQGESPYDPRAVADPLSYQIQNQLERIFAVPPTTASPKEDRLQSVQRDVEYLEGLQEVRNDAAKFNNLGLLEQKLRSMGLWAGSHPGLGYEDSLNRSADDALANLSALNREKAQLSADILGDRATGAGTREAQIKQGLSTTGDLVGQLIDQKLRERIGDIGLQGQEVRSQLGAQLAARGLNQSSFGAQRVAQSYLAEQADVASARTASAKAKGGVGSAIDEVTRQIETRRREMADKKTLSQALTAEDVAFDIDASALNSRFKQEVAQLELDAQGSGFLGTFLGGLAGAIGGFLIPGAGAAIGTKLVGASLGARAGGQIGGAL